MRTARSHSLSAHLSSAAKLPIAIVVVCAFVLWLWTALHASFFPIEHYHGIDLPKSAQVVGREVIGWWPDKIALSTIDVKTADLKIVESQLDSDSKVASYFDSYTPPDSTIRTSFCKSSTGDFLIVNVGAPENDRVRVWFHTDWN